MVGGMLHTMPTSSKTQSWSTTYSSKMARQIMGSDSNSSVERDIVNAINLNDHYWNWWWFLSHIAAKHLLDLDACDCTVLWWHLKKLYTSISFILFLRCFALYRNTFIFFGLCVTHSHHIYIYSNISLSSITVDFPIFFGFFLLHKLLVDNVLQKKKSRPHMFETNTKTRTVITWARCISSCLASIPFPFHGDDSRVFQAHVHDVEKADNLPGTKKKQKVGSQNFLPLMRCVPGNRQALCIAILCCLFDAEGAYGPSLLNIMNWIYAVVDLHYCYMLLQIFMTTDHRCRSKIWSRNVGNVL